MISFPTACVWDFIFTTYDFVISGTQRIRTLLLLGRFDHLNGLEIGYVVDELVDLLDP